MPTLTRFVVTIGIVAVLVYGAMLALATFVVPHQGPMSVEVPLDRTKFQTQPPVAP